jgi:hypothetical protein
LSDFRPATEAEEKTLRALTAVQRQLRRLDLRLVTQNSRVRLARTLKAARGLRRLTDLRWHAQITAREADALETLAKIVRSRRVFEKARAAVVKRIEKGSST